MVDIIGATLKPYNTYLAERVASTTGVSMSAGLNTAGATVVAVNSGVFNVKDFGAAGDGTTNDIAAVQRAIDAAVLAGGGTVYFPTGTYWFPDDVPSASLDPDTGNLVFRGDGIGASILHYDEGTGSSVNDATAHAMFKNIVDIAKGFLLFEGLEFRGTLAASAGRRGGCPAYLDYYDSVVFRDCKFFDIANMAMDIHFCNHFEVTGCHLEDISADGIRARDTPNCKVTNNFILRNGDDAIALHTSDGTEPVREGILVNGNTIINGGTIKLLGGRMVNVSQNHMIFSNLIAIDVGDSSASVEGNAPIRCISITDNIIENLVSISDATPLSTATGIAVHGQAPAGATSTNSTVPGRYDTVGAAWIYPWNYDNVETDDTANPVGPVAGVVITGNIFRRTAPTAAAFSDYGYGSRLFQGIAYDPAVDDADLRQQTGIGVTRGGLHNSIIQGNVIEHFKRGIDFAAPTTDFHYLNVLVAQNVFKDITDYGAIVNSAAFTADISFKDNDFDLDHYRANSNSNLDGTYDADSTPRAIDAGSIDGISVINNRFRNCCKALQTNVLDTLTVAGNVFVCGPVNTGTGFSITNKGIGYLERAGERFRYEIIDADPTSATYGAIQNVQATNLSAVPSAGWYVIGAFVRNLAPAIDGSNMVILGWLRLTTGSGHVNGTDWAIIRGSTVSPAT